jgi:hypothetical protein
MSLDGMGLVADLHSALPLSKWQPSSPGQGHWPNETSPALSRTWEDRLRAEGFEPGNRHAHDLLQEWAPAHALARHWCSEPQRSAAEQEIHRLQSLVQEAVRLLQAAGDDRGARRISRGLYGG